MDLTWIPNALVEAGNLIEKIGITTTVSLLALTAIIIKFYRGKSSNGAADSTIVADVVPPQLCGFDPTHNDGRIKELAEEVSDVRDEQRRMHDRIIAIQTIVSMK